VTPEYAGVAATDAVFELAEGILWDERTQLVRWVDILEGRVLSGRLNDGRVCVEDDTRIGQSVGAVALAEDGGLLIAAARGLATISPSGTLSLGPDLLGSRSDVRFNDGSVDPYGAFVVGTIALSTRAMGEGTAEEVLLRIGPDGGVETLRTNIGLSNGIAFSPDGRTIFHADTLAGTISKHAYGPGPLDASAPWETVLSDMSAPPDGLIADTQGNLWVAQWGGSSVRQYAPTGELLSTVRVDAAQVTCAAFVGTGQGLLAITSAQEGLSEITDQAGAIFLAEVNGSGLPGSRWAGDTTHPYWLTPGREEAQP